MKSIDLLHYLKKEMQNLEKDLQIISVLPIETLNISPNQKNSKYSIMEIIQNMKRNIIEYEKIIEKTIQKKYIGDNFQDVNISWLTKLLFQVSNIDILGLSDEIITKKSIQKENNYISDLINFIIYRPSYWITQFEGRDLNAYFIASPIPLFNWNMAEFFIIFVKKTKENVQVIKKIIADSSNF